MQRILYGLRFMRSLLTAFAGCLFIGSSLAAFLKRKRR